MSNMIHRFGVESKLRSHPTRVHKEALFTCLDNFAKMYEDWEQPYLIPRSRQRDRKGKLSLSEMLFIMVNFT